MVARSASPSRAAAYVITSREARSISVRMISGTPARPACLIPGRSGRSGACSLRAARSTTHTSATAEPTWASRVPYADPAMPSPAPYTSATLRAMLARLPTTATISGVRVSCRPRSTPVAASISSRGTVPSNAICR